MVNYDEKILAKKEKREQLIKQMEQTKIKYMEHVEEFAIEWFSKEAKYTVTKKPENAVKLGEEKLKELKNKVNDLIDDMPAITKKYLDESHIWWHMKEDDKVSYYPKDHRILEDIDKRIRFLFGELGSLLSEYDFVIMEQEYASNFNADHWKIERGEVRYSISINYPNSIISINRAYIELISKTQDVNREIDELEKEKAKTNIGDLWDSL